MEGILLIFIKNPVKGQVKTRLAQSLGDDHALEIYQRLLKHTQKITSLAKVRKWLYYSSFIDNSDGWPNAVFEKRLQKGSDLGKRMENAFREALGESDKVIIIGSDCPGISIEILEKAFSQLDHYPFVLGPASDGGYYLLGMRELHLPIFRKKPWSRPNLFDETIGTIREGGSEVFVLPMLHDIDRMEDLGKTSWI